MNEVIHLSVYALLASAALVGVAALISFILKLKLEKDLVVGTIRAFVQLLIVGYILDAIFSLNRWYLVSAWLLLMIGIASYNAMRRQASRIRGLTARFFIAIFASSVVTIIIGIGLIIRPEPFWGPQYLIPIGGMIVGNAMSAAAVSVNRLSSEIKSQAGQIEAALSLGSGLHDATLSAVQASVKAGMLNIISTTMVVGLVHLPGMMTGQIVGGVAPSEAVRYQLVIMFLLLTTTALASLLAVFLIRLLFFDQRYHLLLQE